MDDVIDVEEEVGDTVSLGVGHRRDDAEEADVHSKSLVPCAGDLLETVERALQKQT